MIPLGPDRFPTRETPDLLEVPISKVPEFPDFWNSPKFTELQTPRVYSGLKYPPCARDRRFFVAGFACLFTVRKVNSPIAPERDSPVFHRGCVRED
jgi:hypothetical protein